LNIISQGNTLAKVIENNTSITNLQADVFLFKASISGTVYNSSSLTGVAGITVLLKNASGDVVAATVTNSLGRYSFNQLSGPAANSYADGSGVSATGNYQVVVVLPSWMTQTTSNPGEIDITEGGMNVQGVNFGVRLKAF
jgi:hypothetical protein